MMFHTLAVFSILATAWSREAARQMPAITNSLVNLGKMEVAFYLNRHEPQQDQTASASSSFFPKTDSIFEEPCACTSLRGSKDPLYTSPSSLFNKILTTNELFTFNKEPISSSLCCESHEHTQEGTIVFEFPANQPNSKSKLSSSPNFFPFLFDTMMPSFPNIQSVSSKQTSPLKTKSIEILLLPNKNENKLIGDIPKFTPKKDKSIKDELKIINIVGDKELPNHNVEKFKPVPPPSIKKDLNTQENKKDLNVNLNMKDLNVPATPVKTENVMPPMTAYKDIKIPIDSVSKTNSV